MRINDKADATFIVDTGSDGCFVSESLVARLGLTRSPALTEDGKPDVVFGKPAQGVTFDRLEFASYPGMSPVFFQPLNGQLIVIKDEHLRLAPSLTVDGILGATFLDSSGVGFDFRAGQMILFEPGMLSEAQARQLGYAGPGGTEIPLTDNGADQFFISAMLDTGTASRSVELLVDTGGKLTTIPQADAKALSLKPLGGQPITGGTYGAMTLNKAQISSMSLGSIKLLDRPVLYPDKQDYPAILGMDILKGYKVLLDFPAHKMYLMPNPPLAPVQFKSALPPAPAPTPATTAPPVPKQP